MLKNLMQKSQKSKEKILEEKEVKIDIERIDIRVQTSEDDFFKHRFLGEIVKNDGDVSIIFASTLYNNFLYQLNNEKGSNFITLRNDDNQTEVAIRIDDIKKIVEVQRIKNIVKHTIKVEKEENKNEQN
jgi:hypothetical protein